jgi:hypothetical protein
MHIIGNQRRYRKQTLRRLSTVSVQVAVSVHLLELAPGCMLNLQAQKAHLIDFLLFSLNLCSLDISHPVLLYFSHSQRHIPHYSLFGIS